MTVGELFIKLSELVECGHANTDVIAYCHSKYTYASDGEEEVDMHFLHIHDVYYQSGDIEIEFSNEKER